MTIFIATVFGGVADTKKMRDGFPLVNYSKEPGGTCYLNFDFQSKILAKGGCLVEDVTESFCQQMEKVRLVWCDANEDGIAEYTDEKAAACRLKELYSDLYQQRDAHISLEPASRPAVYEIKKGDSFPHQCMAIRGQYTPPLQGESKYSLSVPLMVDGLEAINWVKTELTLTESVLDRRVHFSVKLGPGQTFYTPDFTWYFAPPPGSAVNEDTAMLILGDHGREIPNNIQNLRDDTTVLFREWEKLDIEGRRKARIQPKQLDEWKAPFTALSEARQLTVSFEIFNPEKESNRQFMMGLVVAFVLSFCSDKTRINDFYDCLKLFCKCTTTGGTCICKSFCNGISIIAPLVVLITVWVYAYAPQKCLPSSWRERHHCLWRVLIGLRCAVFFSFSLLAIYIFGLWPVITQTMGRFISCSWNQRILLTGCAINLICGVVHIGLMKILLKRSPKF